MAIFIWPHFCVQLPDFCTDPNFHSIKYLLSNTFIDWYFLHFPFFDNFLCPSHILSLDVNSKRHICYCYLPFSAFNWILRQLLLLLWLYSDIILSITFFLYKATFICAKWWPRDNPLEHFIVIVCLYFFLPNVVLHYYIFSIISFCIWRMELSATMEGGGGKLYITQEMDFFRESVC